GQQEWRCACFRVSRGRRRKGKPKARPGQGESEFALALALGGGAVSHGRVIAADSLVLHFAYRVDHLRAGQITGPRSGFGKRHSRVQGCAAGWCSGRLWEEGLEYVG